ncbi:beta-alanine-activating enzyme isoform X2 [Wyeomyia smithii]|nr:beta-alanine-activating enzyme isoform X2 [Wyeomyia smithii]XP_055541675.1 beta-alanine-activating enzyme isoform X2 [Wyeomyia smithii]
MFCNANNVTGIENYSFDIIFELNLLGEHICLIKLSADWDNVTVCNKIAYCVLSSGSTGQSKLVQVPANCIKPNLDQLEKICTISQQDRIFIVSPPSFDPFIVDIFLALRNGASVILVANEIRLDPDRLLRVLFDRSSVTFMQITPSLFRRWNERTIQEVIFQKETSLRNLILGGEPFPTDLHVPVGTSTNVYNIYGITEISCWALIEKVNAENVASKQVSLGSPLDQTIVLQLRDIDSNEVLDLHQTPFPIRGQLFVGSRTRKCLVNGELAKEILLSEGVCYRDTGDVVELRSDEKFYYSERCDQVIKRFGVRASLAHLELICDRNQSISKSFAVFDAFHQRIFLFYTACGETDGKDIEMQLRAAFRSDETPDEFIAVNSFPLSAHGKIDKKALLNHHRINNWAVSTSVNLDIGQFFTDQMNKLLGIPFEEKCQPKRRKLDSDLSFFDIGGTSIQAVQLITSMQEQFTAPISNLINLLLDKTVSLRQIYSYLQTVKLSNISEPSCEKLKAMDNGLCAKACFNMNRCIDATPSVFYSKIRDKTVLAVGSHSHKVIVIDANQDNSMVSQLELPNRVESSVTFLSNQEFGLIGCYDGFLYCFDLWNGEVRWKFNSNGMIKCKALVIGCSIIFGNYSNEQNLFALNLSGSLVWNLRLGTKGILSSPISLNNQLAFVATLDGTCSCFRVDDGAEMWTKKLQSAIFANSVFLSDEQIILVAEVQGSLHCFSSQSGIEFWRISTVGNIFSTPLIQRCLDSNKVLLGCHDEHLYCFEYNSKRVVALKWKLKLQSPIYAGPVALDNEYVIACSTSGYINAISTNTVQTNSVVKLNGEIFSTPVVVNSKTLFVGCRDNILYKIFVDQKMVSE